MLLGAFLSQFVAMPLGLRGPRTQQSNLEVQPRSNVCNGYRDCAHSEKLTYTVAQLNKNENHKTSEVWNKEGENGSCKQDKSEAVWLARNGIGSS